MSHDLTTGGIQTYMAVGCAHVVVKLIQHILRLFVYAPAANTLRIYSEPKLDGYIVYIARYLTNTKNQRINLQC